MENDEPKTNTAEAAPTECALLCAKQLSNKDMLDLVPIRQNGWSDADMCMWMGRAVEREIISRSTSRWISVKDRLPEPKTMCLVFGKDGIQISYFTPASKFALDALYGAGITHWMNLVDEPST